MSPERKILRLSECRRTGPRRPHDGVVRAAGAPAIVLPSIKNSGNSPVALNGDAPLDENLRWLLSFYRHSELTGAAFFGRLAANLKPGSIQMDMTRHFADEAQHARLWTDCLARLGAEPLKLGNAYQDRYLSTAGLPTNLMEVLAITQVFEQRVVRQYARHRRAHNLPVPVLETLDQIIDDERWHIRWVRDALVSLEPRFGRDEIEKTLERFKAADREVYGDALAEHGERVAFLLTSKP